MAPAAALLLSNVFLIGLRRSRRSTLFPYTTLFRSGSQVVGASGSGPGTINVNNGSALFLDNTQNVASATVYPADKSDTLLTVTAISSDHFLIFSSSTTVNLLGSSTSFIFTIGNYTH